MSDVLFEKGELIVTLLYGTKMIGCGENNPNLKTSS